MCPPSSSRCRSGRIAGGDAQLAHFWQLAAVITSSILSYACDCCPQSKLESIQFKLRIPQRKPWGAIAEDATGAAITMGQVDKVQTFPS